MGEHFAVISWLVANVHLLFATMVTCRFIISSLLLSAFALAIPFERIQLDDASIDENPNYPDDPSDDDINDLLINQQDRTRRYITGGYAGGSSYSTNNGGVPNSGGSYSVGTYGPGGYTGYTGNFGNPVPNYAFHNFYPMMPYTAVNPYDINSLFNMYFHALQNYQQNLQQNYQQNLQQPFVQFRNAPEINTRQISVVRPPFLPTLPQPGSGQLGQQFVRALCQALQRLQVNWANTSPVCSGQTPGPIFGSGGPGLFAFVSNAGNRPGADSQVSVSAPPGAVVQPIRGPEGNLQGVSVTHQGPAGEGSGGYVGTFSSSSSSSSNLNGETQSHHASTTGINNNGQTTIISSHSP